MKGWEATLTRAGIPAHPVRVVLLFALPVLALKLVVAGTTFGTNDIGHWTDFTNGVRQAGPIGVYGLQFPHSFYNHPPLIGYFLWFVNGLHTLGIPINFTIRAVSSIADVGTALLLLAVLRRRLSLLRATAAAVLVAVSPLLFIISGFHGNTDPVFAFLTMLSLFLLVDRRAPVLAGVAIGLAVGIKIVPFVVIPALLVHAWRQGRRTALLFAVAVAVTVAITWGPSLLLEFQAIRTNVIGYGGVGRSYWGLMQIGHWLGDPPWVNFASGPGRSLLVPICALIPAFAVWRRPDTVLVAVAWSLTVFLALATTFGTQYLVWPLAACYLVSIPLATVYSFSAGLVMVVIYTRWSGGFPWNHAVASPFVQSEQVLLVLPWLTLLALTVQASRLMFGRRRDQRPPPGDAPEIVPPIAAGPRGSAANSSVAPAERKSNAAQHD